MHLDDPVGTFTQAYNLLRPETGMMAMDVFPVLYQHAMHSADDLVFDSASTTYGASFIEFLRDTKAPYLRENVKDGGFLLRRPNAEEIDLPLSYGSLSENIDGKCLEGHATFVKHAPLLNRKDILPIPRGDVYGDPSLYQWIDKNIMDWENS